MHPVLKLVVQRIALGLFSFWPFSVVIFLGVEALPGDTAQAILGQSATPAGAGKPARDGAEQPALTRYFHWLGGILTGDLGTALTNGRYRAERSGKALGNTLFLAWVRRRDRGAAGDPSGPDRRPLCRALARQADLGGHADHDQPARIRRGLFRDLPPDPGLPDLPARSPWSFRAWASGPSCTPSPCR
jgi:hypothetical protein